MVIDTEEGKLYIYTQPQCQKQNETQGHFLNRV